MKERIILWICLTLLVTAGLRYVPQYLVEQQKLDQADRILDFKERVYLHRAGAPTVSVPAAARPSGSTLL